MGVNQRRNEILEGQREAITGGVNSINTDHSAIHMGFGAIVSELVLIPGNSAKEYCLTTPDSLYIHLKNLQVQTVGGNNVLFEILSDPTVTVNTGTLVNITNPNDNSSFVSESELREDPTFTGGTLLDRFYILNDASFLSSAVGSLVANVNQELVLKESQSQYIIRISNLAAGAIDVAWQSFWYEEPQGLTGM